MEKSEADLLAVLRALDDPQRPEEPEHYDRVKAGVLLDALVARLDGDFTTRCSAGRDDQDSSSYGTLLVPAQATACGTRIEVHLSKFGSLAVICVQHPGVFLGTRDAEAEGALDARDLAKLTRALADLGYTVVPEELMERVCDGPSQRAWHGPRLTWWDRFFGDF